MVQNCLIIGAGGFLGAVARYLVSGWVANLTQTRFPAGTLAVNAVGSFILALFITLIAERILVDPAWRLFWAIGFLGAFTTFSTFAWETDALLREGNTVLAAGNVVANVIFALLAVRIGLFIARL